MSNTKQNLEKHAVRIARALGLPEQIVEHRISNQVETESTTIHRTSIRVKVTQYESDSFQAEVLLSLPEDGVLAQPFMDACAELEKIPKNHSHEYCHGPRYRDYASELLQKTTHALSPWNNHYLIVESRYYPVSEAEEAVDNVIALAKQFIAHLDLLQKLRYWKTTDKEVIEKAKEIVANADLYETDCDREERAHWLRDRNSFIKGWFMPFNDSGRGSFDTLWPSSVDYAAKSMGNEGSFEYAVACLVLVDPEYIRKGRKACIIRKETRTIIYKQNKTMKAKNEMTVPEAVTAYLKQNRISKAYAARMLGITPQALHFQLKNPLMSKRSAQRWNKTFGIDMDFLMTGQGSLFSKPQKIKKAILAEFAPMTRLVVEIPEGVPLDQWLQKEENLRKVSRMARAKIAADIGDYLCIDNLDVKEDIDFPAWDDEKPSNDPDM